MLSCVHTVAMLSKGQAQSLALYPQSTDLVSVAQKLVRRVTIHTHSLVSTPAQPLSLFFSVNVGCTRYPQALWIQINKEDY